MTAATHVWGEVSVPLHLARLRHFAEAGVGETLRRDGAFAVVTDGVTNIENGIVCERRDVDPAVAAELVAWIQERGHPACWGSADAVGERLHETLVGLGCREETTGVDMGSRLADLDLPQQPPAGVELDEVRDEQGIRTWIEVANATGLFDDDEVRDGQERLYARVGVGGPFGHWLAWREGRAVGMATGFYHDGAALLEHIAVRPEEQRRGIGRALVAVWLLEGRARGCDVGVLGPTPDSQVFYERLGFTLTRVRPRHWYYLPVGP
jgi:GNAT superfamily N-acetyltransferase